MERQFWKPNTVAPGIDIERDAGHDDESGSSSSNSGFLPWNTKQRLSISQQQQMLPIYARKQEILYAIETNPVTILIGETGSGKTTQLPQYLRHAGWCAGGRTVVCTQPRRVAAVSVAARVAEECKSKMGHGVGYAVRFDRNMDKGPTPTQLQFVTDGLLLRMLISDPLLQRYSVVIVDEAHERSLATDLLLGLLKKVQAVRRDLRIVISSATLDYASFRTYFTLKKGRFSTPPGVVMVQGRQHVTTNHYLEAPCKDYLRAAIESVDHLHRSQKKKNGDILVFLTGKQQVEDAVRLCGELGHRDLLPLCLYSGLPASAQVRVFQFDKNQASRKVVFSTNVAEASVTIPNIGFVVDCGFVKHKFYDPETGVDSLEVVPISQASARQRAGRAGRVAEGHCFRLYPESTLTSMMPQSHQPELQRSNLARLVLQMKSLAVDDLMGFDFISPPSLELLADAMEQLFAAGAVDEDGKLTSPVGTMLASFPLSPALGRMVLCASDLKCTEEVLTIVAMLTVQNVLIIPSQHNTRARKAHAEFSVIQGDMLTYLNIYNNFLANNKEHQWCRDNFLHHGALKRAVFIRKQLRQHCVNFKLNINEKEPCLETADILKCIVSGLFAQAAQLQSDGTYKTVRNREHDRLTIHPSSVLSEVRPPWIVYNEMVVTDKHYIRDICNIQPKWLMELAPHYYQFKLNMSGQRKQQRTFDDELALQHQPNVKHRRLF